MFLARRSFVFVRRFDPLNVVKYEKADLLQWITLFSLHAVTEESTFSSEGKLMQRFLNPLSFVSTNLKYPQMISVEVQLNDKMQRITSTLSKSSHFF